VTVDIRIARPDDAAGIAAVMEVIAGERKYSAIDRAWSVDQERRYMESLSPREAIHVAVDAGGTGRIVGLQIVDRWSALDSTSHVGQLGTFLLPAWRRQGVGRELSHATLAFAREAGYKKIVIYVRASNGEAQAFYQRLGFLPCGRLTKQVIIDGVADDEVMMELHL
jgi:ribosomal protein S18 acetylase RimI-like enzyme